MKFSPYTPLNKWDSSVSKKNHRKILRASACFIFFKNIKMYVKYQSKCVYGFDRDFTYEGDTL